MTQKATSLRPARSVAAGFLFMTVLIAALAGVGLYAVDKVSKQTEHVIQDQRNRLDQLYNLRAIIHERMLRMTWTMLDPDPFRRDEYYAQFLELGNRFIEVRVQIESMLMSPEEALEMAKFREQTMLITLEVDEIFLHLVEQRSEQVSGKLVERVVPAQARIMLQIDRVITLVQKNHEALLTEVHQLYRLAFLLIATLGLAAVLLAAFIGWRMTLRISADRKALIDEMEGRQRTEQVLRAGKMGYWDWNLETNQLHWSDEMYRIFGRAREQFACTQEAFFSILHPDDKARVSQAVERATHDGTRYSIDHRIILPDGSERIVHFEGEVTLNTGGQPIRMLGAVNDITEAKHAEKELNFRANHDPLSGLPNRSFMLFHLQQAIARAQRNGSCVAVMMCDLDGFKNVNDSLGHAAGDQLIVQVAEKIRGSIRAPDVVSRVGGDEFTIVLEDIRDDQNVIPIAQKILQSLATPFHLNGHHASIGMSIGICCYPMDGETAEQLLENADQAMYRAKQGGKNRYEFHVVR